MREHVQEFLNSAFISATLGYDNRSLWLEHEMIGRFDGVCACLDNFLL